MEIIDPVSLGDVASARPSPKNVYDGAGNLVTVPAGTAAISYDPSDLGAAPFVMVEPAATNLAKASDNLAAPPWVNIDSAALMYLGSGVWQIRKTAAGTYSQIAQSVTVPSDTAQYTFSVEVAKDSDSTRFPEFYIRFDGAAAVSELYVQLNTQTGATSVRFQTAGSGAACSVRDRGTYWALVLSIANNGAGNTSAKFGVRPAVSTVPGGFDLNTLGAVTLRRPQFEVGGAPSSYWPTTPTFVSRANTAMYFDGAGVLQTAPVNVARMTYDPADLTRPPYLLVENAATNLLRYSAQFDNAVWTKVGATVAVDAAASPDGTNGGDKLVEGTGNAQFYVAQDVNTTAGTTYTLSVFAKAAGRSMLGLYASDSLKNSAAFFDLSNGTVNSVGGTLTPTAKIDPIGGGWYRCSITRAAAAGSATTSVEIHAIQTSASWSYQGDGASGLYIWGAQLEAGAAPTSYTPTGAAAVTRAADVVTYSQTRAADTVSPGVGLVYSNVPIAEPDYNAATTYAKGAKVHDPVTHLVYESLIDANTGTALTDPAKWAKGDVTNRWKMFDQYNNTQTTSAEEIVVVLSPETISQGFYVGNLDATEVRLSVVDLYQGVVYRETIDLRVANSASSFYNWCFNRIKRKTWAVSLSMPPYANALITIAIRKPGGTAKCGMCVVGATVDIGKTLMGLGAEVKDFSDTQFNFDGTSRTTLRGYAKRLSVDVSIDSDQVDAVYEALADYRQKPLVWIGSQRFGIACAFGRYTNLRPVIKGQLVWEMALQIEGTV